MQGSYRFDGGFRLHAATGTGVKAPGVYELYGYMPPPGGFISNPDLKPEKSQGWEAGVELTFLGGMAIADVTYFNSTLEDEIVIEYLPPNFDAHPYNASVNSPRDGVEAALSLRLAEQWRIDASYTYLHSEENGLPEVRRPENIASLNVAWRSMDDMFGANLTVRYNGEQKDFQFTPIGSERITLDSYTLVNFGADYRINETLAGVRARREPLRHRVSGGLQLPLAGTRLLRRRARLSAMKRLLILAAAAALAVSSAAGAAEAAAADHVAQSVYGSAAAPARAAGADHVSHLSLAPDE